MALDQVNTGYLIAGLFLGIMLSQLFGIIMTVLTGDSSPFSRRLRSGFVLSADAQKDLDFVFEKTGFKAHYVNPRRNTFNGYMQSGDPVAEKLEAILWDYSKRGYVFTNSHGLLIGCVTNIITKADRVAKRRAKIRLVVSNKTKNKE